MGGGSSSSTQGTVVQTTAPWAAMAAGQLGANAADEAATLATNAINTAITQMNSAYQSAASTLQPYRLSGIQALNKLNSYLGLDAYNPGAAPTAPKMPTLQEYADKISHDAVVSYLNQRTQTYTPRGASGDDGVSGDGSQTLYNGVGGIQTMQDAQGASYSDPFAAGNAELERQIKEKLAQNDYNTALATYNANKSDYDKQLEEYNQIKSMYDTQTAAGPMTQAQITENITNQPGYQAELAQGIDAIGKQASARGYLGSGSVLKELANYGQNTLSKYYGNTLSQLAGVAGMGQEAATNTANIAASKGNNLASLYNSMGDAQANAALSKGNSLANALTAANQQFNVIQTGSSSSDSGGGGLGGIGSLLGGVASLYAQSAKHLKDTVSKVDTATILKHVDALELDKWKYKGIDREHIGPYAGQFKELFGVGDGEGINMIDMMGVMLGAIKELSQKVKTLEGK